MKKVWIGLINIYQSMPLSSHKHCRYTPTCSEYMKQAINMYGSIVGIKLGIRRLLRCRPHGGYGYDPVPILKNKRR